MAQVRVKKPSTAECPTAKSFAEFFAGIGLVHAGLQPSGWDCVYANDLDPKKYSMYASQFGAAKYYHVEDVWNTDAILSRFISRPFLATASFPCIDLSLAGHWRGLEGQHSSSYFGFLEVLRQLDANRPKVVMLENVYGFLTSRGGKDFRRALEELASLGYWIDAILLDARWFVPQSRPRLFLFGFHDSLDVAPLIRSQSDFALGERWHETIQRSPALRPGSLLRAMNTTSLATGWASVALDQPQQAKYRLMDYLDLDDSQAWWSEPDTLRHYRMMEPPSKSRVDELIRSGSDGVGTAFRRTRRGSTRTEVRFDVAGCLRTPRGGSAKQIVVAVIDGRLRMRWMSSREYARLQGAPHYRITVSSIQAMYGFGDAVCVPAITWIDENILTPVYESATCTALGIARSAVAG